MSYELTGFDGKVALVTGAGRMRSIGRTVAVELARAGCDLLITGTGRSSDRFPDDEKEAGWRDIESVADEIRALGRNVATVVGNIADEQSVSSILAKAEAELGGVDILINNAGAARGNDRCPLVDLELTDWRKVIDVNLTGTFLMSRAVGRHMIETGRRGSIVNISSIAGKRMPPQSGAYAASKAGVHALTGCMAQELGSHHIRVNAVCPGLTDTSRMDGLGRREIWTRWVEDLIPLQRAGTGSDIAAIVLYLCSDQASWVTGQSWNVDGGQVVQH